jgi:translation initiation factor 3 subunit G
VDDTALAHAACRTNTKMATTILKQSANRWGDLLEEEEPLPPSTVSAPDARGIVTKVDYYRNDKGDLMKRTTRSRVVKVEKKTHTSTLQRRANWVKFGDAATERPTDAITSRAPEDVPFERVKSKKQSQEDKQKEDFQVASAGDNKAAAMSLRELLHKKRMERQLLAAKGLLEVEAPPEDEEGGSLPSAGSRGGYVPPSLRNRGAAGEGDMMQKRRDENSVRVTNLSEDVVEQDLLDLFGRFGHVQRIFIAKDRETGESRGFAFVNFARREDAQDAINTLDGFGYANLILSVSWAAPRERN